MLPTVGAPDLGLIAELLVPLILQHVERKAKRQRTGSRPPKVKRTAG